MNLQEILDNAVKAQRHEALKNSPQLLLGEMILKLEAVKDKKLSLFIDIDDQRPIGVDSWRGSYSELAIQTKNFGSYNTDEVSHEFDDGEIFYKSIGKENPTVQEWIDILKEANGKTFTGYKGGDFLMGKNTPVWLAEYGDSCFNVNGEYLNAYFVDVKETSDKVYLVTKAGEDLY